jgi:hypothetical protein
MWAPFVAEWGAIAVHTRALLLRRGTLMLHAPMR